MCDSNTRNEHQSMSMCLWICLSSTLRANITCVVCLMCTKRNTQRETDISKQKLKTLEDLLEQHGTE